MLFSDKTKWRREGLGATVAKPTFLFVVGLCAFGFDGFPGSAHPFVSLLAFNHHEVASLMYTTVQMMYSTDTPCPSLHDHRRLSTVSQDTTTDLDYTRAVQAEFARARPRRRQTTARRKDREAAFTIFEGVLEDEELVLDEQKGAGRGMLLGKPAQRLPLRPGLDFEPVSRTPPLQSIGQSRRMISCAPLEAQMAIAQGNRAQHGHSKPVARVSQIRKDPRRRTIFVPSDDTTIATIHPGARTFDSLDDTFQLADLAKQANEHHDDRLPALAVHPLAATRRPRTSLAVAPKRMPLQQTVAKQPNAVTDDVVGHGGGKENYPPGSLTIDHFHPAGKLSNPAEAVPVKESFGRVQLASSQLYGPPAPSQARESIMTRKTSMLPPATTKPRGLPPEAASVMGRTRTVKSGFKRIIEPRKVAKVDQQNPVQPDWASLKKSKLQKTQQRLFNLTLSKSSTSEQDNSIAQQFPLLASDVLRPELYEDDWLSTQEIALTQLMNAILEQARPQPKPWEQSSETLREHMLVMYHTSDVTTLHRRLQASLLYGALSQPKQTSSPPRLTEDLGLRRKFLKLWLDSYDEEYLRVAAEVVIGRQIGTHDRSSPESSPAEKVQLASKFANHRSKRRSLIALLETFFIKVTDLVTCYDLESTLTANDLEVRRWQKTVIRSLMLIKLLDEAKSSAAMTRCLFKSKASHKSSAAVLGVLAALLMPSIGDVNRVLHRMDYELSHVQDPLDEVIYRIDNLAVDLRDGMMLARLVELLVYPPHKDLANIDATLTISLPDGLTLTTDLNATDRASNWPLSRHLRMPCLGRATKLYNAQVALGGLNAACDDTRTLSTLATAEDIVDGHREKTLSLIWALVSKFGLPLLVDRNELERETQMIVKDKNCALNGASTAKDNVETASCEQQHLEQSLQHWAETICAARSIQVKNLTTSFADGKAFEAIVDAYAAMLPQVASTQASSGSSLSTKLERLGCSTAFVGRFCARAAIPCHDTTVSTMGFLASRLLPLAKTHRAASRIQRAVRQHHCRIALRRRVALMRIAHDCATVVQARYRICSAATVLQRAWRKVLAVRIAALMRDVSAFQCMSRGWAARRVLRASLPGSDGADKLRTMGGW